MPPPGPTPSVTDKEKSSLAEAQDRGFQTANTNMSKGLKEDMNKSLNKDCEHTHARTHPHAHTHIQPVKRNNENNSRHEEIESLKKIQTEINLELKDSESQTKTSR